MKFIVEKQSERHDHLQNSACKDKQKKLDVTKQERNTFLDLIKRRREVERDRFVSILENESRIHSDKLKESEKKLADMKQKTQLQAQMNLNQSTIIRLLRSIKY